MGSLGLEYNQRKTQEDLISRQYQMQKQYYDQSVRLQGMQGQLYRGEIPKGLSLDLGSARVPATPGAGVLQAAPATPRAEASRPVTAPAQPATKSAQSIP